MNSKKYDPIDGEYGRAAELAAYDMMRRRGFDVVDLPHGIYGKDLLCRSKCELFYVECERRYEQSWGPWCELFPYPEYNFPARRVKEHIDNRILIVFRSDLAKCLIVFYQDLRMAKKVVESNRHVDNETIYKIPVNRCLLIDTFADDQLSFAEMNRTRIMLLRSTVGKSQMQELVDGGRPYGVTEVDYHEILNELTYEHNEHNENKKTGVRQYKLFD